jgi:flagellar hook protein FlgE
VTSIVNGLFSGRSGIGSNGAAIAVVGDNISNSNTIGYKTARAEFEDLVAGGQAAGRVVGSGSSVSAVSTINQQGTLEFTSRPLDLAIDGNGFFVVKNNDGSRYYSRAGNFKVNSAGVITTQGDLPVLGFPANGSGALDELNINNVSQDSVGTTAIAVNGNVNANITDSPVIASGAIPVVSLAGATASITTYAQLDAVAAYSTVVETFDSLGESHTLTFYFFHTDDSPNTFEVRGYTDSEDVDPTITTTGLPRLVADATSDFNFDMVFGGDGSRTNAPAVGAFDKTLSIPWRNGSNASSVTLDFSAFTSYSTKSNINSVTQNGKGVGAVTSLNIEKNGDIFALLSNGQSAVIGTVGLVNFSNPEGLTRVGNQLLQKSSASGEPIVGNPQSGTLGSISSGAVELSTVDIADQFVKLITLQRAFQANSRIITTINQLLNEIIQLA